MISGGNLPPYNRFDKVPCHALQCGNPQPDSDIIALMRHHSLSPTNDTELHNNNIAKDSKVHSKMLDPIGSRHSLDSNTSAQSHDSFRNSTGSVTWSKCSTGSESEATTKLEPDLYIEPTSPPPYGSNGDIHNNNGPSRTSLPKKSKAAQQIVADLLKKPSAPQKPFGVCYGCNGQIAVSADACQAMGQIYHNKCFSCCSCGRTLREKAFYCIQGRIYCQEDYMYSGFQQTIEKCYSCGHLIMDLILQAMGKSFHPGCFRCTECNECLDGVQFTIDVNNKVYCVADFHRLFAPKCAACDQPIVPIDGSEETVRVVALDKDYHIDCYQCERCKTQLTDEADKRCYPIGERLLCYDCHLHVRSSSLPSPSASSTSSSHSTNSNTSSYRASPGGSVTMNGQVRRRKTSSPLTTPTSLLQSTIPEELPDWAKPARHANNNQLGAKRPQHLGLPLASQISSSPRTIADPNLRLQEKIRQHVVANEDFKLKQNIAVETTKETAPTNPSASQRTSSSQLIHENVAPVSTTMPFKSVVTFTPQPDKSAPFHSTVVPSAGTSDHYTSTAAHTPQLPSPPKTVSLSSQPTSRDNRDQSQNKNPNTHSTQPVRETHHVHVAPRAVPIDLAVPLPNTKRHNTPRKRIPLNDVIMHKKIAESLKKSLASGARYPSPESISAASPGSRPLHHPKLSTHSVTTSRTPSPPPQYMKVWQASEVARSTSSSGVSLAIPQEPVQSQELPPRLLPRREDNPPGRPPKLHSFQITKI